MNDVETDTVEQPAGEDLPNGRERRTCAAIESVLVERAGVREREAAA
jgi:hypothetical protein